MALSLSACCGAHAERGGSGALPEAGTNEGADGWPNGEPADGCSRDAAGGGNGEEVALGDAAP
jgi:hypothetical protein